MLVLAVAAVGAAYTVPFGDMRISGSSENAIVEYGILGMETSSTDSDESEELSWRDPALDDGDHTTKFRTGFWLVPIGALVMLGAAFFLMSAPSAGPMPARIGAAVGIVGALVLAVGAVAFLMGFSDTTQLAHEGLQGDDAIAQFDGRSLRAGMIWMGTAIVVGLGGSVLGFSDKVPTTRPATAIRAE